MIHETAFIHPEGLVDAGAEVGAGTRVWAWAHVLGGARIGRDCNICDHCFIENKVVIGDRVTVKCNVSVWNGVMIGDDVFVGPSVAFTNDTFPRSRRWLKEECRTQVGNGASIGANATVLPVRIGEHAMIGAGAVVTRDVPPYAIVKGNPARVTGYVDAKNVSAPAVAPADQPAGATGAKLYRLPHFSDMRGELNVVEFEKHLPFPIRRMFYTYGVDTKDIRGEHAHRTCEQFLIAVHGSLSVIVDDSEHRDEYRLDNPSVALHLPSGCWGIQYRHSPDCVLVVLASEPYDESDYIRTYDEFLAYRRTGGKRG